MLILDYTHATRTLTKDLNGTVDTITVEEARDIYESGEVDDYNLAFHRLVMCDYDMDEVEESYRTEDGAPTPGQDTGVSVGDLARDAKDPHDIES